MQEKAVGSVHAFWEVHRELGIWEAAQNGAPKAPFCCSAQVGGGAQPVPLEQVSCLNHRCPCSQQQSQGLSQLGSAS